MKKWLIAFSATAVLLTACVGEDTEQEKETQKNSAYALKVEKGKLNVDVTLPANFFIGITEEDIITQAKGNGVTETVVNKDGSVTYTMSKLKYKEMMQEMRDSVVLIIDKIVSSGEDASIKEISYNEDFTEFDVKVNRQKYQRGFDGLAIFELVIFSAYYSAFDGKSEEDLRVILNMVDEATGEIYDAAIYPDRWELNRILGY